MRAAQRVPGSHTICCTCSLDTCCSQIFLCCTLVSQYRIFHSRDEFEEEVALYRDPALASIMPDLLYANDNESGSVRSLSGYAFPPFFVLERGVTLLTWVQEVRNFFEVSTMVEALARLLDSLHEAGYVHRDIKVLCASFFVCVQYLALSAGPSLRSRIPGHLTPTTICAAGQRDSAPSKRQVAVARPWHRCPHRCELLSLR